MSTEIVTNVDAKLMEQINTLSESKQRLLLQRNPHPSCSDKYSIVRSYDVLKEFVNLGFEWNLSLASKSGKHADYAAHVIQLSHPDLVIGGGLAKEVRPVINLGNSYDKSMRFSLDLGIFRSYCLNGLFVGTILERVRQKHINIKQTQIQEAVLSMKTTINERLRPMIEGLMNVEMSQEEQLAYAKAALSERFRKNENFLGGQHEKLLTVHREEDRGNSKWLVLNRVQENLGLNSRGVPVAIKYQIMSKDGTGKMITKERNSVERVEDVKEIIHLNQTLFDLALERKPTVESIQEAA